MYTINAHFAVKKPVLGLHNQLLGYAASCKIDVDKGELTHVELTTQWQSIEIQWGQIVFDGDEDAFRLLPKAPT